MTFLLTFDNELRYNSAIKMEDGMLELQELREILDYNPLSGEFKWKKCINHRINTLPGDVAGGSWQLANGFIYWRITLYGVTYGGHQLAWFYMTGEWHKYIDHKDGNGLNNRYNNLRPATAAQNQANRTVMNYGVSLTGSGKYRARMRVDGVKIHIGTFNTPEEAHEAYRVAHLNRFGQYSGFARKIKRRF